MHTVGPRANGIVALLTDFGTSDPYVGIMKGAIASINPQLRVIDLTHEIAPHDLHRAAFFLAQCLPHFPTGTTFVSVVDPGVGGSRKALAVATDHAYLVGPDNGLLPQAAGKDWKARTLTNPCWHGPNQSTTFHGRDIFAPVGAHLANGTSFDTLGPLEPQLTPLPSADHPRIICIDHFGNAITNVPAEELPPAAEISCGSFSVTDYSPTYATVPIGHPVALINSYGLLELAINQGSAHRKFQLEIDMPVAITQRKTAATIDDSSRSKYYGFADHGKRQHV